MAKMQTSLAVSNIKGRTGGTIYYTVPGRGPLVYARTYNPEVAQPRTVRQINGRALLRGLAEMWRGMTEAQRAYWQRAARGRQRAWNAFCEYNFKQLQHGWMPQLEKHSTPLSRPPAPTDLTAVLQGNALVCAWTDSAGALTSGIHLVHAIDAPASMSNLVACTPAVPGTPRQATIIVAPGTYYVVARSGAEDGGTGEASAVVGPVVIG